MIQTLLSTIHVRKVGAQKNLDASELTLRP
jgi:hypothetical protein